MRRSHLAWIRTRLFGALVLLALLACGGWALQRQETSKRTGDAQLINLVGRQRMLSQRIAFLASSLPQTGPAARARVRVRLLEATTLMRTSNEYLKRRATAPGAPRSQPPPSFEPALKRYLAVAEAFARSPAPRAGDPRLQTIRRTGTSGLLDSLDLAVSRDEARAEAGQSTLQATQTAVLLATLALLLATAVLLVRPVLRRVFREIAFVSLLEQVATAANDATSITDPLQETLAGICALAGCPTGHALLLDGETGELVSTRVWHQDAVDRSAFRSASADLRFAPGDGLPGRVLATGRPAWTRDVQSEPNFPRRAEAQAAGLRGAFAFPLLVRDRVVGVLEFFSTRAQAVDPELLAVMEHLGKQLGRVVERHQAAEELTHQAGHDALTGLPNRALLLDRLANAAGRSHRSDAAVGVLFVDVDRFKALNDALGHRAGDELIVAIARRLDGLVRGSDTVGRFGGDEFVVLCDELEDESAVLSLAARIGAACTTGFDLDGEPYENSVSVGVAVGRGAGLDPSHLLRDADLAVHRAKELGGGRVELFDPELRAANDERTRLETALRHAVEQRALDLAYQPIIEVGTGALLGFEALVRWTDPELGPVSPVAFIPVAEATGLIGRLGMFVLEAACEEAAGWASPAPLRINVNLSARQVADPRIVERVRGVLHRTGLDPARLGLELTETALLEETETTVATLERLKGLGVELILDDFGTGYSSLGHLRRFPIDEVKIDRSFVARMEDVAADLAIVSATVGLAASLGLGTVAEGVETPAQLEALRRMGCHKAQGYLIDRPLTTAAARARVAAEGSLAVAV